MNTWLIAPLSQRHNAIGASRHDQHQHQFKMTTPAYETEEMEAPAFLADPKVLAYLEGTDADMSRLVLEEDGLLWAYSRRSPAALCRCPLLEMVALAFPRYAPASQAPQAVAEMPKPPPATPSVPKRPRAPRKAGGKPCALGPIPTTGVARGLLGALSSNKTGGPPRITINGERRVCPPPAEHGETMRVVVATDRVCVGFANLSRSAYDLLTGSTLRPDTLMFNLMDGLVTTRVRGGPGEPRVQGVDLLLAELGSIDRLFLEGITAP